MHTFLRKLSSMAVRPVLRGLLVSIGVAVCASGSMTLLPTLLLAQSESAATEAGVPRLVRFNGTLVDGRGFAITTPVAVTFAICTQPVGDEPRPLWQETQQISPNSKGGYTVLLGSTTSGGIPVEVFKPGESQYLSVKAEGEPEQARVLLVSVPYALKAGDAATLGGLPASAFALSGQTAAIAGTAANTAVTPDSTSTVTTPGGASGYLPVFSGTSTIHDSIVFQNSLGIGIGDVPNGALDVNGKSIFRGPLQVARIGNATPSSGVNSNPFSFYTQAYDTATNGNVGPYFSLQAESYNNNTSSPTATLNLLYDSGLTPSASETGISFDQYGDMYVPYLEANNGIYVYATTQEFGIQAFGYDSSVSGDESGYGGVFAGGYNSADNAFSYAAYFAQP